MSSLPPRRDVQIGTSLFLSLRSVIWASAMVTSVCLPAPCWIAEVDQVGSRRVQPPTNGSARRRESDRQRRFILRFSPAAVPRCLTTVLIIAMSSSLISTTEYFDNFAGARLSSRRADEPVPPGLDGSAVDPVGRSTYYRRCPSRLVKQSKGNGRRICESANAQEL